VTPQQTKSTYRRKSQLKIEQQDINASGVANTPAATNVGLITTPAGINQAENPSINQGIPQ